MARLAAADLVAATNTTVYTVPTNRRAVFTISLCNRNATAQRLVRVALQNGALSNSDYIEYDAILPAGGVLERSGVMLTSGQVLMARADAADVSCVVYGIEEQT
ncbi:MAG: hypothetical protein ACK5VI_10810 [Opitutia bacterium]|jgi:hypothetical protein